MSLGSPLLLGTAVAGGLYAAYARLTRSVSLGSPLRIPLHDAPSLDINVLTLGNPRLRAGEAPGSWFLQLEHRDGVSAVTGQDAVHALGLITPRMNWVGASPFTVRDAVSELSLARHPADYFRDVQARIESDTVLSVLPRATRLALEMAANEDTERLAIEGDLALLARAWRDAETIAAVADSLLVPANVQAAFERLHRRARRHGPPDSRGGNTE